MNTIFTKRLLILVVICLAGQAVYTQTSAKIESEMLGHLGNIQKYASRGGNFDMERLDDANKKLKAAIVKYGALPAMLGYGFPRLKDKMFVATSRDGKFRIYSWDTETGGTMHDFDNVFQYRSSGGSVHTHVAAASSESGAGSFYTQVFQVDTPDGRVYLANSSGIYSTSLAGQALEAYRIDGDKFVSNVKVIRTPSGLKGSVRFSYDFFSVVDHPERPVKLFFFDETKRSFRFPVVIADRKTPQGRVTNRFITYRFNGKYFEKVS